ncbi:MAG: hypothetical protein AB7U82_08300 [Blastocatellales bacterium]
MGERSKHGGRRLGAGRKQKPLSADLTALLDDLLPRAQRVAILKRLIKAATDGDIEACKLLFAYAYGKPKTMDQMSYSGAAVPVKIEIVHKS